MMLSERQAVKLKWRLGFVAVALCGFFYLGPQLRSQQEPYWLGRKLLVSQSAITKPSCILDGKDWKREVKLFFKNVENPANEENVIKCPEDSNTAKRECKVAYQGNCSGIEECPQWDTDLDGTFRLEVTADECRTPTTTCFGKWKNKSERSFPPPAANDPMFPEDIFTEKEKSNGAIVLHIIGLLYMFYALALVCDHYFVPSLDVIIEKFGISPDVAGATFMAAGGSAPELFTSVIGVFIAVSDVGIGTIVGSAVFNVLFVIAACAFASATALKLTAWPLIRDTTFYSIALMVLVIFFMDDFIQWWEALILFAWYFAYVAFMKFNPFMESKFLDLFPSLKQEEPETPVRTDSQGGFKGRRPLLQLMSTMSMDYYQEDTRIGIGAEGLKTQLQEENNKKIYPSISISEEKPQIEEKENEDEYKGYVMSGLPEGGFLLKAMWIISLPLMIPMMITIPDPQNEKMKKFFPVTFIVSILWIAVFSYFMVWWATITGETLGISDAVMGLTFLAAGTSVPDLITSVLVAKEGKGDMAVSSSIGSNLFDVTVGLPFPWLLYTIINGEAIEVNSVGMGCSIGMLFVMLMLVFLSIIIFKWKMTKPMGGVMLVLYMVFVVVSLGLSQCWFPCPF